MLIEHPFDVAMAIRARRRHLKLRQIEVARAANVGREWLVDLEHGKPTVELGLVMRTLSTLGLEVDLRATLKPPGWSVPLTAAATGRETADEAARRRDKPRRARPRPEAPEGYRLERDDRWS